MKRTPTHQVRLLSALNRMGLTDEYLSACLREGHAEAPHHSTIGRWRRGERGMDADTLCALLAELEPADALTAIQENRAIHKATQASAQAPVDHTSVGRRALPPVAELLAQLVEGLSDAELDRKELTRLPVEEAIAVLEALRREQHVAHGMAVVAI